MKKNGFVFIESVVVLVVVALSLTMLITSYSLISRKTKEKEDFNRTSDKYLLYVISSLGVSEKCNYSNLSSECGSNSGIERELIVSPTNCKSNAKVGYLLPNCDQIFTDYDIKSIYVVNDIKDALERSDATTKFSNGTIEYMKTLKKCDVSEDGTDLCVAKPYMIGEFKRGDKYYYASIEL